MLPTVTSKPPSGPAFAIGTKDADPGLPLRFKPLSVRFTSFSKMRGGRAVRSLSLKFRLVSPVSRSNSAAGSVFRPVSDVFPLD